MMWPFSTIYRLRRVREKLILDLLSPDKEMSGFELGQAAGIYPGALYPDLMRLEDAGAITSRWGQPTAERGWRRPRLYRLGLGQQPRQAQRQSEDKVKHSAPDQA